LLLSCPWTWTQNMIKMFPSAVLSGTFICYVYKILPFLLLLKILDLHMKVLWKRTIDTAVVPLIGKQPCGNNSILITLSTGFKVIKHLKDLLRKLPRITWKKECSIFCFIVSPWLYYASNASCLNISFVLEVKHNNVINIYCYNIGMYDDESVTWSMVYVTSSTDIIFTTTLN
jgi:hypothetical protein